MIFPSSLCHLLRPLIWTTLVGSREPIGVDVTRNPRESTCGRSVRTILGWGNVWSFRVGLYVSVTNASSTLLSDFSSEIER